MLRAVGPVELASLQAACPFERGGWGSSVNHLEAPRYEATALADEEAASSDRDSGGSRVGLAAPLWLPRNATAVRLEGLAPECAQLVHGAAIPQAVPVTYARVVLASPLAPDGPRVVVEQALVDTGSADCELREGLFRRLWPLPLVARGLVYETVAGRVEHDSYEVLLMVEGRCCAAAVTLAPEERFDESSEDPCTDEAIIGFAALAALRLAVDCSARVLRPLPL